MSYDPEEVIRAYDNAAKEEDRAEKLPSLRTEIPRAFIQKYLRRTDVVLDAGGGTGINAIMMARRCQKVTLLDLSPRILQLAARNIEEADLASQIELVEGDITDLRQLNNETFSFIVCVGDSISYTLDRGPQAIQELVRVARRDAILVLGCDSRYGFMRLRLSQGELDQAVDLLQSSITYCGMGPRTRLYTASEMTAVLESAGCQVLEVASTPTLADTIDRGMYTDEETWQKLKALELQICTRSDLLGIGAHLLFVARKSEGDHIRPTA